MRIKRGTYKCDICEELGLIGWGGFPSGHIHFKERNFTICIECLIDLAAKHIPDFYIEDMANDIKAKERDNNIEKNNIKKIIPSNLRWEIWERDNFTCKICGSKKYLEVDHIFPESKGGDTDLSNLQTLCKRCNGKKGNKILKE